MATSKQYSLAVRIYKTLRYAPDYCLVQLRSFTWVIRRKSQLTSESMFRSNRASFARHIRVYENGVFLMPPEETILTQIKAEGRVRILIDMGVGRGRTTRQFSSIADLYIALDYSPDMIRGCKNAYRSLTNAEFLICDSRMLPFRSHCSDFVLFSFNGIDYMNHENRGICLREIKRVITHNGSFLFSTHNIRAIPDLFKCRPSLNPVVLYLRARRAFLMRLIYPTLPCGNLDSYVYINDGADSFGLMTHYTGTGAECRELENHGFYIDRVLGLDGRDIRISEEDVHTNMPFNYFLVRSRD